MAQWEAWWLKGGVVALGRRGGSREAWWLNGSAPDCCPAVPGSNPADCPSPGGLPPGMALGRGLTSVRGNRGKKLCKMDRWFVKKHININNNKRQRIYCMCIYIDSDLDTIIVLMFSDIP